MNQRFQRKQFANVSVIKTEKKGYGLRADADMEPNDFIFEYIGEVINEPAFRRRMIKYDEEGIKHFYFMSLSKSEFVDATRKGNLGRFCNHSCSPNCYVDKWVVGDKLRMGIFALRTVKAGEELVFNYNVDRYGADPQPCYCGEPNCVGFIGGKTQTERATKLPAATVDALGIDLGDGWDTSVSKKVRKKKSDEDDEEYIGSLQPRALDEDDSKAVMAALMQCKEKWIAVKLLDRIQRCHEEKVIASVMRMHAYQILKTVLNSFREDDNVVIQILSIFDSFPRLTRNKIQDSNIEASIEALANSENEDVASRSKKLLEDWSKLEMAYRIRRRKVDANAPQQNIYEDRRGQAKDQAREEQQSKAAAKPIDAPKGPKNSAPLRQQGSFHANAPARPRQPRQGALPQGWFTARDATGNTYFYNKQGTTTWERPTQPAEKGPSKAVQEQLAIQSIIDRVTKEGTPKMTPPEQLQQQEAASTETTKKDKWRALPVDKQMKIYENTVFPPVKFVLDKFKHKLPKDELKRLGKDIAKKLVSSDYKNNRVTDPTVPLSDKQDKKIKTYVKEFLDRAVHKFGPQKKDSDEGRKRKRDEGEGEGEDAEEIPDVKRVKEGDVDGTPSEGTPEVRPDNTDASPPTPPPPPPPGTERTEEMREQEAALMRENEEAQRIDEESRGQKQEVMSH